MRCPYCNKEMRLGVVYGDRYKLKWISEDDDKGIILQFFAKGIQLGDNPRAVRTYYCEEDEVFIIKK